MKAAVICAFNEEDTIGSVVLRTKRYVDKVIVIDDGSNDKTAETAQLAGAKVVQHLTNGGKGEALKTGFEAVEKLDPDVVVCLDADCQHDPDDIPMVIAPILSGKADMVIASRYLDCEHTKKIPRYRRFGLWVLTKTSNFGSDVKVTDTQCGFRAFSGEALGKFGFRQTGFSIESEMLEDAIESGLRIQEVSIPTRYEGLDTSTEKPGKHGLGVLNFVINTLRERRPLFYFGVSGAILLIIGLVFAILSVE
ncbi:MAG: glycosyltransferase family 2 protein, partial [Candidatus Thorarchaeota archaeon]